MLNYFLKQVDLAYKELVSSIEGIDEQGSWRRLVPAEGDYLHSDGSILGQVTHVAGCKVLYASAGFRGFEIRLRDVIDRTIQIGSDWRAAKTYLEEAQAYWLESCKSLSDDSLEQMVMTNWGDPWPTWRIFATMIGHDHYHAGQIALTRSVAPLPQDPPPPLSEEEIDFLKTFSAW